jgi:hypothetical protein
VKKSSAGVVLPMVFTLGNRVDAVWAAADKVIPSRIRLRQSTKRLKLASKSTPMIGSWTRPPRSAR